MVYINAGNAPKRHLILANVAYVIEVAEGDDMPLIEMHEAAGL